MRTRTLMLPLILSAVTVVFLVTSAYAQQTEYSENQRLNMESHVGRHDRACGNGPADLSTLLYWLPRRIRRWPGRECPMDRSQAEELHHRDLPLPVHPDRNPADRHRSLRHHRTWHAGLQHAALAAVDYDQDRVNLVAYVKHFSPRWVTEKPGTPIVIPAEPEVTGRSHQARPRTLPEAGVLEVSRSNRSGERSFCRHFDRR